MILGGLQRFSMIDYPGKTSAIVFTVGCNFRCGFCYNAQLVIPKRELTSYMAEEDVFSFLETRRNKLDGVVITGGEPTLHPDLPIFMRRIKDMGFLLKLDSQGSRPQMIKKILDEGIVDYIAMDIKGPLEKYEEITQSSVDTKKIIKSISLILDSGIDHEFRTTIVRSQLVPADFDTIGNLIHGANLYALQKFIPSKRVLDPRFQNEETYTDEELEKIKKRMEKYVAKCVVR